MGGSEGRDVVKCTLLLQRQKEAQASIPPQDMFRSQTDKYSAFDEQGVPTIDAKGQPLSDKQLKKLKKEWEEQKKKFESRSTQKVKMNHYLSYSENVHLNDNMLCVAWG